MSPSNSRFLLTIVAFLFGMVALSWKATGEPIPPNEIITLLRVAEDAVSTEPDTSRTYRLDHDAIFALRHQAAPVLVEMSVTDNEHRLLQLERFSVISPDSRFIVKTPDGLVESTPPDVILLRGQVVDRPLSHAYLAVSAAGMVNGYIQEEGRRFCIGTSPDGLLRGMAPPIVIRHDDAQGEILDGPSTCGVESAKSAHAERSSPRGSPVDNRGPRLAHVAIEADQAFVNLFPDSASCQAYIVQLVGAITDIYLRDLNTRLSLDFVRLWPAGGEPFSAGSISGFREYWLENENPAPFNFVHLLSGTRATSYAGIAYVGGTCSGNATYGISGFLSGAFASPVGAPTPLNWDVIVPAHEMGHNAGTFHTHDGYDPPIDTCGSNPNTPSRGTIMSYCHTTLGGTWNTNMWFHRRVQDVVEVDLSTGGCFSHDCNGNNIPDETDILNGEPDLNGDNIPDVCQDCNHNSIPDPIDILNGAPDVNGNSIPDSCEPDCNSNGIPDPFECTQNPSIDEDGNNVPDSCQPDCNNNGIADFKDIRDGTLADVHRDNIPDICQDCDGNNITDWLDLGRGNNIYIADRDDFVREYYSTSGWPLQTMGVGAVADPYDCTFGTDRMLYVASYANDRIVKLNPDTGASSVFVAAGSGGLDGPSSLVFGPNGNLFVASRLTSSVIQYNGTTGALIGTFVASGSGGLNQPYGLVFGPDGRLYVSSGNNTVIRYNGATGALVGTFVTAGSGGLNSPRGMAFKTNGNLLVASFSSNNILEYNGATGAFVRVFNAPYVVNGAWGLRIAPNGNVYVMRTSSSIRLLEFRESDGMYLRSIVRSDATLITPTGFAFRPRLSIDCNGNGRLDVCEPEALDVSVFVAQLLADSPDPSLVCLLDQNADSLLNGEDIAGFTAKLLAP